VSTCAELRESLGAYVLGALEPDEAAAVEAHLASCERCRDELAELSPLPSLLSLVTLEHASAAAIGSAPPMPSDLALPRVLGQAREERAAQGRLRRRARVLTGLVAAVAVVLAAATGAYVGSRFFGTARTVIVQPSSSPSPSPTASKVRETKTWQGRDAATNVSAKAVLTKFNWGTEVDATMNGMKKGDICVIRVIDLYGREWDAGSWIVNEKTLDLQWAGDVAVQYDKVAKVEIWDGATDRKLLTLTG
jgi:anti-sigma factor ChrR (cupin superfamily)